jgi:dethiobiotin synthetase
LFVEGVGGWLVPINETETMADVAKGLNYPALLVVGIRLGCINHALLTSESIERSGVAIGGWVANIVDRQVSNVPEIIDTLIVRINAPLIGIIPPFRAVTPEKISEFLNLSAFLKV